MKKQKHTLFSQLSDYLICFGAMFLMVAIFGFYFYNVSVKFQINYANLYNQNILSKNSEFNNDIIKVSNSLFTDKEINAFLSNDTETYNYEYGLKISNMVANSTIGNYISAVFIDVPKTEMIFTSESSTKYTYKAFEKQFPEYYDVLKEHKSGTRMARLGNDYLIFSYNDFRGHIISMLMPERELRDHLIDHVYPIFYGVRLTTSENRTVVTDFKSDLAPLTSYIDGMAKNSVKLKGNYLIIKNISPSYSCTSVIRISDVLRESISAGFFIILFMFLLMIFICLIIYHFYKEQEKLLSSHKSLLSHHADMNTDVIIKKIFNRDMISKSDENMLDEYFAKTESRYFLPIIVGIADYAELVSCNTYDDVALYKYGYENIIEEVMSSIGKAKTINMGKDLIGVFLYGSKPFDKSVIQSKISYFQNVIKKNFDVVLFAVIGRQTDGAMQVYRQLPSLITALNYRFVNPDNIIFTDKLELTSNSDVYPVFLQTEIISHINAQNKEEFLHSLIKFADYIRESNSLNAKEWYLRLFLAISENCHSNPNVSIKYNTLETMLLCDRIAEMSDLLAHSIEYINSDQSISMEEDFTTSIENLIKEEFSNPNFCIQSIAEQFGITPTYFGKKFKHQFNTSFNKYLLEYRLNYAIKLLCETDYSNAKIAALCGFNSETYFITIFKKNFGISPKQYKLNL